MKELGSGLKEINLGLQPGEQIRISENRKRNGEKRFTNKTLVVVNEGPKFITVDTGNYKDTINKIDIQQGLLSIERMNEEVIKTNKFTKEELKELYKTHKRNARAIFEVLGAKADNFKQVQNAIRNWKIKESVNSEQPIEPGQLKDSINEQSERIESAVNNQNEINKLLGDAASGVFNISQGKGSSHEVERFKKAAGKVINRPSGKLKIKSVQGQNDFFTIDEKTQTVIISALSGEQEYNVPFKDFSNFSAEASNFNRNYLRRYLKK